MSADFVTGFVVCMICDAVFSVVNMFVQKAFYYRDLRKHSNDGK